LVHDSVRAAIRLALQEGRRGHVSIPDSAAARRPDTDMAQRRHRPDRRTSTHESGGRPLDPARRQWLARRLHLCLAEPASLHHGGLVLADRRVACLCQYGVHPRPLAGRWPRPGTGSRRGIVRKQFQRVPRRGLQAARVVLGAWRRAQPLVLLAADQNRRGPARRRPASAEASVRHLRHGLGHAPRLSSPRRHRDLHGARRHPRRRRSARALPEAGARNLNLARGQLPGSCRTLRPPRAAAGVGAFHAAKLGARRRHLLAVAGPQREPLRHRRHRRGHR
jgi:hypothetical protein